MSTLTDVDMSAAQLALEALKAVLHDCDDLDMVQSNQPGRDKGPWLMATEAIAALEAEIAQEAEPGVNQLIAQLHDDQKWTVSEQQQFAKFLKRFPNESSQGIISLGDAWMHGKACAAPQSVNAELREALQELVASAGEEVAAISIGELSEGLIDPDTDESTRQQIRAILRARAAIAKAGAKP